ncbi:hypothetical protein CC1G_03695 [Coprinopsis cinerea okayama7|uniref:Ino eighty subunit 1 n=1 Tax=Coprinopsis cinerea (strain Okayama-7 / 130 / ATCC MYA-4618 / FGSC 9003) TaxID=240176 RepID=A8N202_COPC7|nr:hypothetical protein CC1G_03695 [Coprinopsis cinerea okayama7\|eukprot:XP_001828901.2 hypothetical protein CC1G_03695 [Coprinopsis cinerea okayama7\
MAFNKYPPGIISPGYLSRKALPIKKNDAEPLTREDVQYDLLDCIFSDTKAVFTDPFKDQEKVTFGDLYISALHNSNKCSKVLKDKMVETPAFAIELGKISLLTNVGRINTTMAFFPEMKTALRTYHPVPSLQKTDGNAQDAPRIKNCLKAALLASESKGIPPATPEEILSKRRAGLCPPTSVVNLVFVLSTHAAPLSPTHFDGTLNFLDLFIPGKGYASYERAQAFLWFIYHYLEDAEGPNPFADKFAQKNPGKAPQLRELGENEVENIDTQEEIQWGRAMSARRNTFLQQLVSSLEYEKRTGRSAAPLFISVTPENGTGRRSQRQVYDSTPREEGSFLFYVPSQNSATSARSERGRNQHALRTVTEAEVPAGPRLSRRNMVDHAWIIATTTDPLDDSDGERGESEHVLLDYGMHRCDLFPLPRVLSILRYWF